MRIKRIAIWYRVLTSLFATWPGVKSEILDAEATVEAIKKGRSLIRFGDGEFGIYMGKDIHYQKWSQTLQAEFQKIKHDYEATAGHTPYILAVPKTYMQCSSIKLCRKRVLASSWAQSRAFFKKNFNRGLEYGDAFVFEKGNFNIYSRLWLLPSDNRTILFIHNNEEYARKFENTYKRDVIFIKCPPKNAFESIDEITKEIDTKLMECELQPKDVQFVVSAGPAGKIIVYKYAMRGYHCIDAGHCWDAPLES